MNRGFFLILTCVILMGCSTPKAVEEHHHHHYEADTMAVQAHVDRQLNSWHEEMTQFFNQKLEEYTNQQQQSEQQHETISELITETTDSLGRKVRQEQRTISRDITREIQQIERRLTQEYEQRLTQAVDSVGSIYQKRYDSLASHVAQMDSTLVKKTPVGDTRPWYKRLLDSIRVEFVFLLTAAVIYLTRRLWLPLIKSIKQLSK